MIRHWILLFAILSPLAAQAASAEDPHFFWADDVNFHHQSTLHADASWLQAQKEAAPELARVIGEEAPGGDALHAWLKERVKVILSKDWTLGDSWEALAEKVDYPLTSKGGIKSNTVAINIGSALYAFGKRNKILVGVNVPGLSAPLAVKSPRVGLVQIGDLLFSQHSRGDTQADRIFRLSALFHEARHSDGNGPSLGFQHSPCPPDSDLPGISACDANRNGPYSVDAQFALSFLKSCKNCTEGGRDFLRITAANSLSRVISVLKKEEMSCNEATCRVTVTEAKDTTEWDTTPESLD